MNIQLIKSALGISYYIQTEAWSVRRLCPQPGDELTGAGVMVSVLGRVCHTGAAVSCSSNFLCPLYPQRTATPVIFWTGAANLALCWRSKEILVQPLGGLLGWLGNSGLGQGSLLLTSSLGVHTLHLEASGGTVEGRQARVWGPGSTVSGPPSAVGALCPQDHSALTTLCLYPTPTPPKHQSWWGPGSYGEIKTVQQKQQSQETWGKLPPCPKPCAQPLSCVWVSVLRASPSKESHKAEAVMLGLGIPGARLTWPLDGVSLPGPSLTHACPWAAGRTSRLPQRGVWEERRAD